MVASNFLLEANTVAVTNLFPSVIPAPRKNELSFTEEYGFKPCAFRFTCTLNEDFPNAMLFQQVSPCPNCTW